MREKIEKVCAFCDKTQHEVAHLIERRPDGPVICDECIGMSADILKKQRLQKEFEWKRFAVVKARLGFPETVCLCGSTRFYQEFQRADYEHTMAGRIVLSVGFDWRAPKDAHGEAWGCTPEQKIALDSLHFCKIELADFVYVVNVGGYIGESTRNEINHAKKLGKRVEYLEVVEGDK